MPLTFITDTDPQNLSNKVRELAKTDDILQINVQTISPIYHIAWMRVRKGKKYDKPEDEKKEDPLTGLTDLFGGLP